ncbi:hypothetical protein HYC85_019092 [Camellia sinensis]|uniref:Uncharacterized protein n=1 Tax=Camellia sinensis TaxID=4442 RepID=A0A7J7GL96_CAMSI|nr:hypothetical protein HYC85_019092 [Camellia sinensis]
MFYDAPDFSHHYFTFSLSIPILSCAAPATFKGFLIAMPRHHQQLIAYRLDSDDGLPKSSQVLHKVSVVFHLPFPCDDLHRWFTRVAILRFLVKDDGDGHVVP